MFRKRILLVSLLKPVTDTRLYEKLGKSLAKLAGAEVHVAGFATQTPQQEQALISLHPVFLFKRLSWQRFAAQFTYWRLLQKIKPDLVVVGTHELLLLSWFYCLFNPCKLVYDVQENYFLNLSTQKVYPVYGKWMAYLVRAVERITAANVHHFFLAEESYAQELPFIGKRFTVLQNKYLPASNQNTAERQLPVHLQQQRPLKLLFSGTISRLYGVMEAVSFTEQLRQYIPHATLSIMGYCADGNFLQELRERIKPLPFIKLSGGEALVPHQKILEAEQRHHIGLLPYHPHPSTFNCVPTKVFEYIGNGLVTIAQENPLWQDHLEKADAGFCYDFSQPVSADLVKVLLEKPYYLNGIPQDVFWNEEEQILLDVISHLLQPKLS